MFDIGLFEILVVGGVGLVVIGPEKLPGAIRTGALWVGRLKRSIGDTRREIEQHIGADEIRRELRNEEIMASLEKLREARTQLEQDINAHASGESIEHTPHDEDYDRSQENHHHDDSHNDASHDNHDETATAQEQPLTNVGSEDKAPAEPESTTQTKEAGTPPSNV